MVDLNLWRLEYDDVVLDFGTHESGHPLVRQVQVTKNDLETDDMVHPLSDGVLFGVDLARGMVLEFAGAHLTTMPQPWDRKWEPALDGARPFETAWRARSVRRTPGKLATLTNLDRGVMTYGRPRPYAADLERVRQGWLVYACAFAAVDDRFYGLDEQVATMGVDPSSVSLMTFPVEFPFTQGVPTETRTYVTSSGTDDTWPVVTFRNGPQQPRLELLNDMGGVEWSLKVNAALEPGEELEVDCRPWRRTVLRNGTAAPGVVRGSSLDAVRIPPGTHELRFVAVDPTGNAEVQVRWRDAFDSL